MQFANNNQVEDFLQSNGAVIQDFSGKSLELKYPLKSKNELENFLGNKADLKKKINEIRQKLKFSKIICRFYFGKYNPAMEQQKELISLQEDIFDEITVQMIGDNFDDFKALYGYAMEKVKKPISTLIDPLLNLALLSQINVYLGDVNPANARWIYHRLGSNVLRYRMISKDMQKLGIDYYMIGCNKRYGGETEFKNIDVSTICKGYLAFKGCCLDYNPSDKDKKGRKVRFAPNMDSFQEASYEWEITVNQDYKSNRLRDWIKLDGTNPTNEQIIAREKVKKLFQHLDKLNQ